jgi:hypothetical protein
MAKEFCDCNAVIKSGLGGLRNTDRHSEPRDDPDIRCKFAQHVPGVPELTALEWRYMPLHKDLEMEVYARTDLGLNSALVRQHMIEAKVIAFTPDKEFHQI